MRIFIALLAIVIVMGISVPSCAKEDITAKSSTDASTESSTKSMDNFEEKAKKIKMDGFKEFDYQIEELEIITSENVSHIITAELADTPHKVMQGLMYRHELAEDKGMLFIFSESKERRFWMRNTYVPLDLLYIESNGTIHHIHHKAVPLDETPLPSNGPVQFVLEIPGGQAVKRGIQPGDKVYHWIFGNRASD